MPAGLGDGAAFVDFVVTDDLGVEEAALEFGLDYTCSLRRGGYVL